MPRRPTVVPDEINLTKVQLNLLVDGISPKGRQSIKHGTVDVQLNERGMTFSLSVTSNDGNTTEWAYNVRKFPSEISVSQSDWKVEKGKVIVILVKKDPMSWQAMMRRGVDQADSSDED